eukprot:5374975-Heterocapsa_arctica.AAC.1
MNSGPVECVSFTSVVKVVVEGQVVMGMLSGPAPEVNFCQVFVVGGGVEPVEGMNMGVDGSMIFFGWQNFGGVTKVVEIRLVFVVKNVEETLSIPLGGHGEERSSTPQASVGGNQGDQFFFDSSVVHPTFQSGGSHDGCSAMDFCAELED